MSTVVCEAHSVRTVRVCFNSPKEVEAARDDESSRKSPSSISPEAIGVGGDNDRTVLVVV